MRVINLASVLAFLLCLVPLTTKARSLLMEREGSTLAAGTKWT